MIMTVSLPVDSGCFIYADPATTEIYTLSLHDALPIFDGGVVDGRPLHLEGAQLLADGDLGGNLGQWDARGLGDVGDRKSTRLNSSHSQISYAVFCLKKKDTPKKFKKRMSRICCGFL